MSAPTDKGAGQPTPTTTGWFSWLGGLFGTTSAPAYKTPSPAPPPAPPVPCLPCAPSPKQEPAPGPTPCDAGDGPEVYALDYGTTVVPVPVGAGPITIVIQPRD